MRWRFGLIILLVLLLWVCTMGSSFADGGGGNKPFSLSTSNPTDGQKRVSIDRDINLTFSKNVVNILVKENNGKCFKLMDEDGHAVPIEVIMADDQIEREKRNDIILSTKEALGYGKKYTVVVSKDLMSKSGVTLESDIEISFTTISKNGGMSKLIWILGTLVIIALVAAYFTVRKKSK
jgi:hypothetical protein